MWMRQFVQIDQGLILSVPGSGKTSPPKDAMTDNDPFKDRRVLLFSFLFWVERAENHSRCGLARPDGRENIPEGSRNIGGFVGRAGIGETYVGENWQGRHLGERFKRGWHGLRASL